MITKGLDAPKLEVPHGSTPETATNPITLNIEDENGCPAYNGTFISNVTITESPDWLKEHLIAIGLTPKNNAVDITNFVLHTFWHPLHAFDADAIDGKTVNIRKAKEGEKLVTLDEVERTLDQQDCIIADATKHLCIAGVMGGANSGVTKKTKNIYL